jgi:hypothetical protein
MAKHSKQIASSTLSKIMGKQTKPARPQIGRKGSPMRMKAAPKKGR